jgi:hypothetical protein
MGASLMAGDKNKADQVGLIATDGEEKNNTPWEHQKPLHLA